MSDDLTINIENDPVIVIVEGPAAPEAGDVAVPDLQIRLESSTPELVPEMPPKEEVSVIERGPRGPKGDPGDPGIGGTSAEQILVDFLAAQDLQAYDPVTLLGTIGDSSVVTQRGKVIGLVMSDVESGFIGQAIIEGEIENPAWSWSPGTKLFLNGSTLSATPPTTGYSQQIAVAETDTSIVVQPKPAILL